MLLCLAVEQGYVNEKSVRMHVGNVLQLADVQMRSNRYFLISHPVKDAKRGAAYCKQRHMTLVTHESRIWVSNSLGIVKRVTQARDKNELYTHAT